MSRGYTLLHQATKGFRDSAELDTVTPSTTACSCCQRPWGVVEDPDQALAYRYSSGYAVEWLCTTCHTLRIGSTSMLGIERLAHGKPVGAKLGMLNSSRGVITPSGDLHLAVSQGWFDKFQDGELNRLGRLHNNVSALALLLKLYIAGELEDAHQGFVFIESWGRKADVLMSNWRASTSLSEVWCVSEKGVVPLQLAALINTARVAHKQGLGAKAMTSEFWRPVTQLAEGQGNAGALKKWGNKLPDQMALMASLPIDPHSRHGLEAKMRELIPLIEGGLL